jgi:hypothetical protein
MLLYNKLNKTFIFYFLERKKRQAEEALETEG